MNVPSDIESGEAGVEGIEDWLSESGDESDEELTEFEQTG
jgi:hypothetical protein